MKKEKWDEILEGFKVVQRNDGIPLRHRRAVVTKKTKQLPEGERIKLVGGE
jgi:hypothetical protein